MTKTTDNRVRTVTSYVVRELRDRIYSGRIPAGTKLRQEHVARDLSVSVTPVREAFFALQEEGLLTSVPRKGVMVFVPSVEDLLELYTIRIALESAATKAAVPGMVETDFHTLRNLAEQIVEFDRLGNKLSSAEFNYAFHMSIYVKAGMPRMLAMIDNLRRKSAVYLKIYDNSGVGVVSKQQDHEEILKYCEAGDAQGAGDAMTRHLQHTLETVQRVIANAARGHLKRDVA